MNSFIPLVCACTGVLLTVLLYLGVCQLAAATAALTSAGGTVTMKRFPTTTRKIRGSSQGRAEDVSPRTINEHRLEQATSASENIPLVGFLLGPWATATGGGVPARALQSGQKERTRRRLLLRPTSSDKRVHSTTNQLFIKTREKDGSSLSMDEDSDSSLIAAQSSHRRDSNGISWLNHSVGGVVLTISRDVEAPEFPSNIGVDISFDVRTLQPFSSSPLVLVAHQALTKLGLYALLSESNRDSFLRFVDRVASSYNDCPYHRELHAADVTSRVSCLLDLAGLERFKLDAFSAILAAIVHDVDHEGLSNTFHDKANTELSQRWRGSSPLENHSIEVAFAILDDEPGCNFLSEWSEADRQRVRDNVVAIVHATDLKHHFDFCSEFQAKIAPKAEEASVSTSLFEEQFSTSSRRHKALMTEGHLAVKAQAREKARESESRFFGSLPRPEQVLVLQMVMKAADIGHCCMPLGQHLFWCSQLEDEMVQQGNLEKSRMMEVSPMCDDSKDTVTTPSIQLGFFDAIVIPLLGALSLAFPSSKPLLIMGRSNVRYWVAAGESFS